HFDVRAFLARFSAQRIEAGERRRAIDAGAKRGPRADFPKHADARNDDGIPAFVASVRQFIVRNEIDVFVPYDARKNQIVDGNPILLEDRLRRSGFEVPLVGLTKFRRTHDMTFGHRVEIEGVIAIDPIAMQSKSDFDVMSDFAAGENAPLRLNALA